MVKELMQTNRELRDTVDTLNETNERNESDLYSLQVENRDLRDRIEILESVIATTTHQSDFDQFDWRQLLLAEDDSAKKPQTSQGGRVAINEMANELIESKKANRQLSLEVETLRTQMSELQSQFELETASGSRQSQSFKMTTP